MSKQSLVLFISLSGMFLVGTSVDLYTPSMPAMAIALHSDTFHIKNTISIYFIFFAIGQILFGTLSDIFGRRPILLLGIVVFVIASFFAAKTNSVTVLLIMRAIQGFSAASPSVVCKALLVDTRSGEALTKGYAYTAMIWGAGPLIAPFIGGYIHHFLGWQANFYTFAIYGTLLFLLVLFFLKETHQDRLSFNAKSILARHRHILTNKLFIGYVVCNGLGYCVLVIFSVFGPFLIQTHLHYSAIAFGYTALFVGSAFLIGSTICRAALAKFNKNAILTFGFLLMFVANIAMLFFAYFISLNIFTIVIPIFLIAFATGITIPILSAIAMAMFPNSGGIANAALGFTLYLLGSIATWLISFLHPTTMIDPAWFYFGLVTLQIILILLIYSYKKIK